MTTTTVAGVSASNGVLGRVGRPTGQLWQVPMFGAGVMAILLVAVVGALVPQTVDDRMERDLATIRAALAKPGVPSGDIIALAESCVSRGPQHPQLAGTAHYFLGAIYLRQALAAPADRNREFREKAAPLLESAANRGVASEEDVPRLTYLRGKLLYLNNGDLGRIIELLNAALPGGTDDPGEGYGMLVQTYLRKTKPDLEAALAANSKQIEYCEDLPGWTQARVQRGELLLKLDKRPEAISVLDQAALKADGKLRLKIRLMQARAAMDEGLWGKAIPWWKELLADPSGAAGGKGRVLYNLGLCCYYFESPAHEKDAVAAWEEALLQGGDEAQAAALRLGEIRLYSANSKSALELFSSALEKVCSPADYKNNLIDLRKVRELLEDACRTFNEQQDSKSFEQAAQLYKKVAAPGAADEVLAQAAERRGKELMEKAGAAGPDAGVLLEQGRTWLQKAALAWEQTAETRSLAERVDPLWHCIECYQMAKEPTQAVGVLRKFVDLPVGPERKAEAWFTLAEIQRTLKHPAEAQKSYKHCVAFNNPTFKARALLHLAEMALEAHDLKEAEDELHQVAYPADGLGDRVAHEMALLMLGNLYYQQRQFEKATIQFKELIKQNPHHPSILSVREQLGDSYVQLANVAQKSAETPDPISGQKRAYYQSEQYKYRDQAREVYQLLAEDLEKQALLKPLSPIQETLRRKSQFVVADCYYDLPNCFEDAFKGYTALWNQYRDQPDGLWACGRLFRCWKFAGYAKLSNVTAVAEVAEHAVEVCLSGFDTLEQAGAFRTEKDRADWLIFLERAKEDLRVARGR
jgi:tetratricopeptide (TPR) repeat protein